MRLTCFRTALLALLLGGRPLRAQSTPEAAASAIGGAIASGDWAGAARLMHPAALRQFRDFFALAISNANLAQAREQLFGMKSTAEATAAPDTVLFAALLKNMFTRQAGFLEAMKSAVVEPLGHIQQGDTVLVVVRVGLKAGGVPITQFDVMPFLRDGAVWRGLLKADITNMAAMLKGLVAPVGG
jgi:hypothetical protein